MALLTRRTALLGAGVLALAAGLAVYDAYLLSNGTFDLSVHELFCQAYPSMWRSLLAGRFDVPHEFLAGESFLRDGKSYPYFGIFPALLRGWWPTAGCSARLSCVLSAVVSVLSFALAGLRIGYWARPMRGRFVLFLATLALGSPLVVSLSSAHLYNEAIGWGCAWASVFAAAFVVFTTEPEDSPLRSACLVTMGGAAGLSLLSRASVGLGVMLAFGLLAAMRLRQPGRRGALLLAVGLWLLGGLAQAGVNAGRWGTPFQLAPMRLHEQLQNNARGAAFAKYGAFRLDRTPAALAFYFLPEADNFRPSRPWLQFSKSTRFQELSPFFDYVEKSRLPLPIMTPALLLFAALGLVRVGRERRWWPLLVGGCVALLVMLTVYTMALRYAADLVPFLAAFGLLGLRSTGTGWRPLLALGALVAVSIVATHVTLVLCKTELFGLTPSMREEFHAFALGRWAGY